MTHIKSINMKEIEIQPTELGFVTSVHFKTRTFFCQLIKFMNEELVDFNQKIYDYCENIHQQRIDENNPTKGVPKKIHRGDVVCAKYTDNLWYRALILSYDKKTCSLLYIDYGNIEEARNQNDLIEVSPQDLNCIERCPFGITCFIKNCQEFSNKKMKVLFQSLISNYVLIKIKERQSNLQWLVELPENGYNLSFLAIYKSSADGLDRCDESITVDKDDLPKEKRRFRTEDYDASSGESSISGQ